MMFPPKRLLLLTLLAIGLASGVALGQAATGQVTGTIEDAAGAVVPGAAVTVTNIATGATREAATGDAGDFAFLSLPPGKYRVEVAAKGFKRTVVEELDVNVTQTSTVNLKLEPSIQEETVTVTAEGTLVQQESSQVGRVIESRAISRLPLPTRNFQQLLTLSPGTSASVSNNTELGRGDAVISVNGQRTTSNSVRINGVDANSVGTNSTPNIAVPATDSLQEFVVQTSLYDASQGRNAGGNVEAVTKSGGARYHGNIYEFLRNDALNANDFFLNAAGRPRPVLTRNQFGGTVGGPVVREKAFFFASYQGTRERNGASLNNSLTFPVIPPQLTDANRTVAGLSAAFGIPAANISPIAVSILNARLPSGEFAIPSATTASGLSPQSGISTFRENQFNGNFDWNINQKHTFSAKNFFASNPTKQANYNFAGLGNGPTQLPGTGGDLDIIQTLSSLTDTYVFGPNVINQARFGFSRLRVTSVPEEPFTASQFGITNPLANLFPGMPTLTVTGLFTLGSSPLADQSSRINSFTFQDTLSIVKGRHRIKVGGEYRRSQVNFYFNAFSRGQLIFPTFANFLLGQSVSIIGSGVYDRAFRVNDLSGFVQDDWKISNRLTLNLGLRYDFYGLPTEKYGRLVNFIPEQFRSGSLASPAGPPNGFVQAGNAVNPLPNVPLVEDSLVPNDKNNFAPRVGLAYRVNESGTLALRGGYGVYYDRVSTRFANTQLFNFPYLALGVGVFRPLANPFAAVPQPGAFPLNTTVPSPLAPLGVLISGVYVDPNLRTPYVQQYNANVQWEFARDFLLDAGYVGSKGTKLLQLLTINQPVYNPATNAFAAPFAPFVSAQKNATGGLQQVQTSSNSHYDSLQLSVTKRFSRGLQFLSAYTFGKSIDYYSGGTINELVSTPGDQRDWKSNRGRSDFDRRHRFVTSFVYDLPALVSNSSAARWILNDWGVNGILTFQSGLPFSVVQAPDNNIIQRANFRPGFAGGVEGSGRTQDRLAQYFNTAAFAPSTLTGGFFDRNAPFGNTGRNILTGPGQKNVDFSIVKFIPFTESVRGEFRTEFFNLFNWANFANPNSNISIPATFGRITQTSAGPRVIQFAFKLNF
ncbi:MAG TPA: TonB-dependent receptor [Pyrinomonadaceae bacterium]|jgi:outer membrane receptor protein involved in Fe transport|nr:TonB-dependent receptor [Pyrinomonadaceae bacterium]